MSTNGPVKRRRGAVAREEALEAARERLERGETARAAAQVKRAQPLG